MDTMGICLWTDSYGNHGDIVSRTVTRDSVLRRRRKPKVLTRCGHKRSQDNRKEKGLPRCPGPTKLIQSGPPNNPPVQWLTH